MRVPGRPLIWITGTMKSRLERSMESPTPPNPPALAHRLYPRRRLPYSGFNVATTRSPLKDCWQCSSLKRLRAFALLLDQP